MANRQVRSVVAVLLVVGFGFAMRCCSAQDEVLVVTAKDLERLSPRTRAVRLLPADEAETLTLLDGIHERAPELHGMTAFVGTHCGGLDLARFEVLERLTLAFAPDSPRVDDEAHAASLCLPEALTSLELFGATWLTEAHFESIAQVEGLNGLRLVKCSSVSDDALKRLSPLGNLRAIDLSWSVGFGDEGLAALLRLPQLHTILLHGHHGLMHDSKGARDGLTVCVSMSEMDLTWLRSLDGSTPNRYAYARLSGAAPSELLSLGTICSGGAVRLERCEVSTTTVQSIADLDLQSLEIVECDVLPDCEWTALRRTGRLAELSLGGPNVALKPRAVLNELPSGQLRCLQISDFDISDDEDAEAIARHGSIESLTLIGLSRKETPGISDMGLAHLARLPALQALTLAGQCQSITSNGWPALGRLQSLTSLELEYNSYTRAKDLECLVQLTRLEELDLRPQRCHEPLLLSSEVCKSLARIGSLRGLRLDSERGEAGDLYVKHLENAKCLENLVLRVSPLEGAAFAGFGPDHSLRSLELVNGVRSNEALTSAAGVPNLRKLVISSNIGQVDDHGIRALARSNLEWLEFAGSFPCVSPSALEELAKGTGLRRISAYGLGRDVIDDAGLAALISCPPENVLIADPPLSGTHLRIDYLRVKGERLGGIAALASVTSVSLSPRTTFTVAGWRQLSALPSLERLELHSQSLTPAGLGEMKSCRTLNTVVLSADDLSQEQIQAVASVRSIRSLHLQLCGSARDVDLSPLANCANLQVLRVDGAKKVGALLTSLQAYFPLRSLELIDCTLTVEDLRALATATPGLEELRLRRLRRGDLDDTALSAISTVTTLKLLELPLGEYTDQGVRALAGLRELRCLEIGTGIRGLDAFAQHRSLEVLFARTWTEAADPSLLRVLATLPRLRRLEIVVSDSDLRVGFEGLSKLVALKVHVRPTVVAPPPPVRVPVLTDLLEFSISASRYTDATCADLSACQRLESLSLQLYKPGEWAVTLAGLFKLRGLRSLKAVSLPWNVKVPPTTLELPLVKQSSFGPMELEEGEDR